MGFGTSQAPQAQADTSGERWELRQLSIVDGQPKTTKGGKVYWRVKDTTSFWYSVWEDVVKANLEQAMDAGQALPCAVQIKPSKTGGDPFYTIVDTGASAEQTVANGNAKAAANVAPGGKGSEFNRRMHPDDAHRAGWYAALRIAVPMVQLAMLEKPEGFTCDQFIKAKTLEYAHYLVGIANQPKTPTPQQEAPSAEKASAEMPAEYPVDDDDIPL